MAAEAKGEACENQQISRWLSVWVSRRCLASVLVYLGVARVGAGFH